MVQCPFWWFNPHLRMASSQCSNGWVRIFGWLNPPKKYTCLIIFVYLRCSMVAYHIHMGLSETTPQDYDHFDSWWSCSNVVKSWCLVHWSLNAPIFLYQTLAPPCQPGPRRPRCFWSGSARCSPGDVVPIRGPLSTESPVLSSQIFSPFFWCCLMFMLNHYDSWLGPMIIWYYLLMMVIGSNVYSINGVDIIVRWVFVILTVSSWSRTCSRSMTMKGRLEVGLEK